MLEPAGTRLHFPRRFPTDTEWIDVLQIQGPPEQPRLDYRSGHGPFVRWGHRLFTRSGMGATYRWSGRSVEVGKIQDFAASRERQSGVTGKVQAYLYDSLPQRTPPGGFVTLGRPGGR